MPRMRATEKRDFEMASTLTVKDLLMVFVAIILCCFGVIDRKKGCHFPVRQNNKALKKVFQETTALILKADVYVYIKIARWARALVQVLYCFGIAKLLNNSDISKYLTIIYRVLLTFFLSYYVLNIFVKKILNIVHTKIRF